jgi:hypothetical protein
MQDHLTISNQQDNRPVKAVPRQAVVSGRCRTTRNQRASGNGIANYVQHPFCSMWLEAFDCLFYWT